MKTHVQSYYALIKAVLSHVQDVPGCRRQQAEYKGERPVLLVQQGVLYS